MDDFRAQARAFLSEHFDAWKRDADVTGHELTFEQQRSWQRHLYVNGQKVWSSGAADADRGILIARYDPDLPKQKGLVYLLIDMRAAGVEVRPLRQIDGGAHFSEVFFSDVEIPDGDRVGEPGEGWS